MRKRIIGFLLITFLIATSICETVLAAESQATGEEAEYSSENVGDKYPTQQELENEEVINQNSNAVITKNNSVDSSIYEVTNDNILSCLNNAPDGQNITLKLTDNIDIYNVLTISENKIITLDLSGYGLRTSYIENYGDLTISGNGKIENSMNSCVLFNKVGAKFYFESGTLQISQSISNEYNQNEVIGIENSGYLLMSKSSRIETTSVAKANSNRAWSYAIGIKCLGGNFVVDGGKIISKATCSGNEGTIAQAYGIYQLHGEGLMKDGYIQEVTSSTSIQTGSAVYIEDGKFELQRGTLDGGTQGAEGVGLTVNGGSAVIGINDGTTDMGNPLIYGKKYNISIKEGAQVSLYDGSIGYGNQIQGKFTNNFYEIPVTFKDDQNVIKEIRTLWGQKVSKIETPVKTGNVFQHWNKGKEEYSFDDPVYAPLILYAQWNPILITGIEFAQTEITCAMGENIDIDVAYIPRDHGDDKTLVWTSSNSDIVLVDGNVIKAVGLGTADVTAKLANNLQITQTCKITVKEVLRPITDVKLNKSSIKLEENKSESLEAVIVPVNTTDSKMLKWSSEDEHIAIVDKTGKVTAVTSGVTKIKVEAINGKTAVCEVEVIETPISVSYRTHVQDYGWQGWVKNGTMSGTSGKYKRLEGIQIKLENQHCAGNIEYRTHVQDYGWQGWVKNGTMSGTSGKAKRLEAIQIRLTDQMAEKYDVYYRVHAQDYGWLGWAKNGEYAGTAGYSKRLEAIQIRLVDKGGAAPGSTANAYRHPMVQYKTHVQDYGWQAWVKDGIMSGTSGKAKRLEGIQISLCNQEFNGNIEYKTHVQDYGWQSWVKNGTMSGTSGKAKRLEAIQIRLTGQMAEKYDIYYRVHAQNFGWLGWAKNGASSGSAGYSRRLEGIQINIVSKGGKAPGNTDNAFKIR